MLVLQDHNGNLMLEKRAGTGIWAGLWSFPEFETHADAIEWCGKAFNDVVLAHQQLPARRHTFSHFHLEITPIQARLQNPDNRVMDSDSMVWYKSSEIASIGVAAAVARIIEEIELPERQ